MKTKSSSLLYYSLYIFANLKVRHSLKTLSKSSFLKDELNSMLNLLTITQPKNKRMLVLIEPLQLIYHFIYIFFQYTCTHATSGPDVGQRSGSPTPPRFHSLEFSPPKFLPFPRVPRQGIPGTPQMRGSPMLCGEGMCTHVHGSGFARPRSSWFPTSASGSVAGKPL